MQCVWRSTSLAEVSLDSATGFEEWWLPDLASIRCGDAPVYCPTGCTQPHPLAKTFVMCDLNAALAAQLAHVGLLAALDLGGDAGDLVDCKCSPPG